VKGRGESRRSIVGRGAASNLKNRFGSRIRGEALFAEHIAQLFFRSCRRTGIERGRFPKLSTAAFRRRNEIQPELFD
jgi:hypothetical protein